MSAELEAAIIAAVSKGGESLQEQPLALNDGDGLRAIILRELHKDDTNAARQQQSTDAMQQVLRTINK